MTTTTTTTAPQLPKNGFLTVHQLIGDKTHPPILPICKSTLLTAIKRGDIPKPVKFCGKLVWHVDTVNQMIASINAGIKAGAAV